VEVDERDFRLFFTKFVNVFLTNFIPSFRTVTCLLRSSTLTFVDECPDWLPILNERVNERTADGPGGRGVFEGGESEFRIGFQLLSVVEYFDYFEYFEYFHYFEYFEYFDYFDYFDYFEHFEYFEYFEHFEYFDHLNISNILTTLNFLNISNISNILNILIILNNSHISNI